MWPYMIYQIGINGLKKWDVEIIYDPYMEMVYDKISSILTNSSSHSSSQDRDINSFESSSSYPINVGSIGLPSSITTGHC